MANKQGTGGRARSAPAARKPKALAVGSIRRVTAPESERRRAVEATSGEEEAADLGELLHLLMFMTICDDDDASLIYREMWSWWQEAPPPPDEEVRSKVLLRLLGYVTDRLTVLVFCFHALPLGRRFVL